MATNYRNKLGNFISFGAWKIEVSDINNNGSKEKVITKGEYELTITKKFIGTSGALFKVIVDCSADCEDYHGYSISFQGDIKAEIDYDRVITSIENDIPIMNDGIIILLED